MQEGKPNGEPCQNPFRNLSDNLRSSLHVFFFRHRCRDSTPHRKQNQIICVGWWAVIKIKLGKNWKGCLRLSNAHKGYFPSLEKAEHALLFIALGSCILMSFLFLGYFYKSVYPFDICDLSHQLIKSPSQHKSFNDSTGDVTILQLHCCMIYFLI